MSSEEAIEQEPLRKAGNWPFGWLYVESGMYAEQVKAYRETFDRVLLLIFERDVAGGNSVEKILPFLGLSSQAVSVKDRHVNSGGYPKNQRLHHWLTPDNKAISLIKAIVRETPLYNTSRRFYRRMIEANLEKKAMSPSTRAMLRDRFRDNVNLLAEQTGLPVHEYWADFTSCA